MSIRRAVLNIHSSNFDKNRNFYVNLLGFEVSMEVDWIMTFSSQASAINNGLKIVYPLTDEPWGVRRFFLLDPNGQVVNVMSHTAKPSNG